MDYKKLLESLDEGDCSESMNLSDFKVTMTKLNLSEETSSKKEGVLCTIEGIFMELDVVNGNDRVYPTVVIKKRILELPYTKRMIKNKTLFGECHHPKDRNEIWSDEVCISVIDLWISEDGKYLMGKADVLDTPKGNIIHTLIKYGSILGISARANGKTIKKNGTLWVDENTYTFKTFDIVTNPGFDMARPEVINEEMDTDFNSICEEFKTRIDEAKVEELKSILDIVKYSEDEQLKELIPLLEDKIEGISTEDTKDHSTEVNEMLLEACESLEMLVSNLTLSEKNQKLIIEGLHSQLRSSKVLNEEVDSSNERVLYSAKLRKSQKEVKMLEEQVMSLMEDLSNSQKEASSLREELRVSKITLDSLVEEYASQEKSLEKEVKEEKVILPPLKEEVSTVEVMKDTYKPQHKLESVIKNPVSGVALNEEVQVVEKNVNRRSLIKNISGGNK